MIPPNDSMQFALVMGVTASGTDIKIEWPAPTKTKRNTFAMLLNVSSPQRDGRRRTSHCDGGPVYCPRSSSDTPQRRGSATMRRLSEALTIPDGVAAVAGESLRRLSGSARSVSGSIRRGSEALLRLPEEISSLAILDIDI
jgi:hypothetical protein